MIRILFLDLWWAMPLATIFGAATAKGSPSPGAGVKAGERSVP